MSDLACLGGKPVISGEFAPYPSMGEAERRAVADVVASGCLSGFYGSPGPEFMGGPKVREFEAAWAAKFGVKHAISMNSNTSGLLAAMGAIKLSPGDEVILPPWTMTATAMVPLYYGAIPVFADIEDETFGLDPAKVAELITGKTKAVLAVNLFGHPARLAELRALADEHGLYLIEDNAQAPLAHENGQATGTVGHIGVASLNFHKHIHTGEGGMCVTNDDGLATRLALIRNHGENCTNLAADGDITNLIGLNLRLTELQAAVGLAQLGDIETHVTKRETIARALSEGVRELDGLTAPVVRAGCRHNYYVWLLRYDEKITGLSRDAFSKALAAEGFPHAQAYLAPLYRLPVFRERKAIGRDGWPFTLTDRTYQDGLCPVTERLHEHEALLFEPCAHDLAEDDVELLLKAIRKVHKHRADLSGRAAAE